MPVQLQLATSIIIAPQDIKLSPTPSCLRDIHTLVLPSSFRMEKWPVAFLLLVALMQVPDVLSRSAGQAAVPAQKVAKVEAPTGFQVALTGLSLSYVHCHCQNHCTMHCRHTHLSEPQLLKNFTENCLSREACQQALCYIVYLTNTYGYIRILNRYAIQ